MNRKKYLMGFTLVELTVALGIISGMALAFLTFVSGKTREVRFGVEYFTGIILSQKVMEDLSSEISINPQGFKYLGIEDTQLSTKIVDGESPFFSNLEDRVPPWNQIDPLTDGTVDSTIQPLYTQVKDFELKVSAENLTVAPTPEKNLYKAMVGWNWNSTAGTGKMDTSCLFFSPQDIAVTTKDIGITFPDSEIAKEIGKFFFSVPATSMFQFASDNGGRLETLTSLAKLQFGCWTFLQAPALQTFLGDIQLREDLLRTLSPTDLDRVFETNLSLAKDYYSLAQTSLQLMIILEPELETVKQGLNATDLGMPVYAQYQKWGQIFSAFGVVIQSFESCLKKARGYYFNLLTPQMVVQKGAKAQEMIILRIMNLYRIGTLNKSDPSEKAEYKLFLAGLQTLFQKRNPQFTRFISQELAEVDVETKFRKRHPQMEFLAKTLLDKMPGKVNFVKTYFPQLRSSTSSVSFTPPAIVTRNFPGVTPPSPRPSTP